MGADCSSAVEIPTDILLAQIASKTVVTVRLDDTLSHVKKLFDERAFHHLLVVEDGVVVGVISDRDLLRNLSPFAGNRFSERAQDAATLNRRVHQVMSRALVVASEQATLKEGIRLMLGKHVSCLPVVDARARPVGIVTWRDILGFFDQRGG